MAIAFNHILVPVDFGEPSQKATEAAIELARRFESRLTLVHVYEIPSYVYGGTLYATTDLFGPIEEAAREHLEKTLKEVQKSIPATKAILRRGVPGAEILASIEELHPDLVVMGTHGRKGMSRALLGSVAEKIVRMSPAPVLTLRDTAGK